MNSFQIKLFFLCLYKNFLTAQEQFKSVNE